MYCSRIRSLLICVLAALSTAAVAGAAPLARAAKAKPAKVQLRATARGKVLVNGSGFTLYVFTHDARNKDTCVKIAGCTGTWPPLRSNGKPLAGRGVKSAMLGTIRLGHGVTQVTYAGRPVYGYVGDSSPGQTNYVGTPQFGGTWYAINAAGKLVK